MKRFFSIAALLVVLAMLITACPPAAAPAPQGEAAAPAAGSEATSGEQVTINWWHIQTEEAQAKNWQDLADEFMKANPNVKIEITIIENEAFKQKLATNMQSGTPPDLFQTWGGGVLQNYAKAGLVQDLSDAMNTDGWGDSFQSGPLSVFQHEGKTYGAPWVFGMVGMWYNKALFEQAGIKETPKTWSDLLATVKALKDAGITPIALGEKDKWPGHFWWVYLAIRNGGKEGFDKAYNRTGSFADPAFIKAGADLKQLIDLEPFQEGYLEAGYGDHEALIGNSLAAMELMGQWSYNFAASLGTDDAAKQAYKDNIGWFPFPTVEGGAGAPGDALGGGDGFAVGKDAPPETIDFVRFLTSKDVQIKMAKAGFAVPPTVKGAEVAVENPLIQLLQKTASEAQYLQLYYDQFLPPAVGSAVNDSVQELFAGVKTPEEVATAIEEVAALELQ